MEIPLELISKLFRDERERAASRLLTSSDAAIRQDELARIANNVMLADTLDRIIMELDKKGVYQ